MTITYFTPLDQPAQPKKNSLNIFVMIFFILSLLFLAFSIIYQPEKKSLSTTSQASTGIKKFINLKYNHLREITFALDRINHQSIDKKKLFEEAKKIYPHLNERELVYEFNHQLFSFWALKDYFKQPFSIPDEFKTLITEVENLKNQYLEEAPLFSGYLIKIRYKGYSLDNQQKLNNLFGNKEIKLVAEEKIKNLINNNYSLNQLKELIENDEEIKILNNSEKALITFNDDKLYPSLFDDPNFCNYLIDAPLNQYSQITELKTFNEQNRNLEDYAYITFFITQKIGDSLHLDCLINKKIKDFKF